VRADAAESGGHNRSGGRLIYAKRSSGGFFADGSGCGCVIDTARFRCPPKEAATCVGEAGGY
jgi:hypothetical protein